MAAKDSTEHTPGPWLVNPPPPNDIELARAWRVHAEGELITAIAWIGNRGHDHRHNAETKANAHLIAAAPKMLEALEGVVEMFGPNDLGSGFYFQILDLVAKAKGRANEV